MNPPIQLPKEYSYSPRWRVFAFVALLSGGVTFMMAYLADHPNAFMPIFKLLGPSSATSFFRLAAIGCALPGIAALLVLARRCFGHRTLELREGEFVVPCGAFERRARVPYIMIKRVWETRTVGNNQSLFVSTGSDVYTIKSAFFPDLETYATVRDFLQTLATES